MNVKKIKKHSHKLETLLKEFSNCELYSEEMKRYVPASRIQRITPEIDSTRTVATYLTGSGPFELEGSKPSCYPNEISYGDVIYHYPPEYLLSCAERLLKFAKQHFDNIQLRPSSS